MVEVREDQMMGGVMVAIQDVIVMVSLLHIMGVQVIVRTPIHILEQVQGQEEMLIL